VPRAKQLGAVVPTRLLADRVHQQTHFHYTSMQQYKMIITGNESVPKIIINDTIFFFLELQSAPWYFKP